jgi:hypothetical protein
VEVDTLHPITDRDLLEDNHDLIEAAVAAMGGRATRRLLADVSRAADGVTVTVTTTNLDRVDAYVDGRPVGSADVADDRCRFVLPDALLGDGAELRLQGFHGGELGAARRLEVPGP